MVFRLDNVHKLREQETEVIRCHLLTNCKSGKVQVDTICASRKCQSGGCNPPLQIYDTW